MPGMHSGPGPLPWAVGILAVAATMAYLAGVVAVRRRGGWWPAVRAAYWAGGVGVVTVVLLGPLADAAHRNFTVHMAGHLLIGMTAPLLLVAAAPITLALRALPVRHARALSRRLAARPMRILTHPVTAAALNGGGLWVLYTTGLYPAMSRYPWLHLVVHLHVLAAGYLFTAALVGVDPAPHRPGRVTTTVALIGFLAAHAVLARFLYAHPPAGVPAGASRTGAELMYYGGDLIDLVLIYAFCRRWYRGTDPNRRTGPVTPRVPTVRPSPAPWRLPDDIRIGTPQLRGRKLAKISCRSGYASRHCESGVCQ